MIKLEHDEKIILKVRKHWLIMMRDIVILGGIVLAPIIIYLVIFILPFPDWIVIEGNLTLLWIFLSTIWLLLFWIMLFVSWTDFYLDILVVTDKRIFDIEQKGLFHRDSSTFRMDRVQDITVEVRGMLATLFRFGHIHIQTAGEGRVFIAHYIPNPYEVKKLIRQRHDIAVEKLRTVKLEKHEEIPAQH